MNRTPGGVSGRLLLGSVTVAAAILVLDGPLPAQAPEGPRGFVAPVETQLVQVDVVVTDGAGRPVPDLAAEDFLVLEDGEPQRIVHFLPGVAAAAGPKASTPEPGAAPAAEPPLRRIVIAIDDLHMSADSLARAQEAVERLVAQRISDRYEVALVATSGSLGLFQGFTANPEIVGRALRRLSHKQRLPNAGGRVNFTEFHAEAFERGDPEARRLATQEIEIREDLPIPGVMGQFENPRLVPEARAAARSVLAQALHFTSMTLGTLEKVVRGLAPVPGRKVLVLVSDGFLLGHGTAYSGSPDLRRVIDASARAGVSVYALDSRGLVSRPPGGDASAPAPVIQTDPAIRDRYQQPTDRVMIEGLTDLAEGTGGFLARGSNDLAAGLSRILADSDASYLLAYDPVEARRDGRFHHIQVKLPRHPDLRVRARKGYFAPRDDDPSAPKPERRRLEEIRAAMGSLAPLIGVPLRMSADYVDRPPEGSQLLIQGHVDLRGVRFERVDERYRAQIEVLGVVYDEGGRVMGEVVGETADLSLREDSYRTLLREGIGYRRSLAVPPGRYQVRIVAREGRSSELGSVFDWVEVPERRPDGLTLSSVFLSRHTGAAPRGPAGARDVANLQDVQARRAFERGATLYYRVYVYDPRRGAGGATDVVLQTQVWSKDGLQGASPVEPVRFAAPDRPPEPVLGSVALEGLAPGAYELRLLVVDRKAGREAQRRIAFSVE